MLHSNILIHESPCVAECFSGSGSRAQEGKRRVAHPFFDWVRPRHGYEISKLIESESAGVLCFNVASLYPLLYRLEKRGWIHGRWVDKAGQRRRRYYQLTAAGKKVLRAQRSNWKAFVAAIGRIAGVRYA